MTSIGNYNLLKLATDKPNYKKIKIYRSSQVEMLENDNNMVFTYDRKNKGRYFCTEINNELRNLFNSLTDLKLYEKCDAQIESIISGSGVFQAQIYFDGYTTCYITGQIYYGFGNPITIGWDATKEDINYSAKMFESYIVSLMQFYGINDLLDFGGVKDKLPIVDIELNKNGSINKVTNINTGSGFDSKHGFLYIDGEEHVKEQQKVLS